MKFTCAAVLLACLVASAEDAIYVNGVVITVASAKPSAEAFTVTNGRFSAVGSNAEIRRLAGPGFKVVDLKGMTVTPGFNDAHLHPAGVYDDDSPYATPWLGPDRVHSMDELIAVLKAKAANTRRGQMVSGSRYDDVKLGRHPNRYDLDKVSTEHPTMICHASGHVTVVNSYVLDMSGITKETKDPPGGSLDRDPDGTPNGVIRESARNLVTRFTSGAADARVPFADEVQGYLRCFRTYAERGITSAGIAGGSPSSFRLYQAVRDTGGPVRMAFMFRESYLAGLQAMGIKSGFGDERLRVTSLKVFHGNSFSGRTCWLSDPYSDRPGYFGIPPARSQEELDKAFQEMHDAGFQIATHSNGDREIDMVLTAIERAQAKSLRPDARHRIEHASVMNRAMLERAKKAGVILVFHSYMWEHGDKLESYGAERLSTVHAYRTAMDMGIHVAGHSDSTVSAADPLLRIQDMVTRKGQNGKVYGGNQRVTVEKAIKVWTLDGAYATFEEGIKGSISAGKLADFAVLRKDPRKVAPDTIKDIVVDATYVGGERVWQAPAGALARRTHVPDTFYGDGDELENLDDDR